MLKKSITILILISIFLSCSKNEEEENNVIRIGFSADPEIFLQERWDRDIKIFTSKARELGAEVILVKSPGKSVDQISQIQYLLDQEIDILVVIPEDKELLGGIISKAMDRKIPVLSYDRPILGVPISGYVSFDNQEVGRMMAEALVSRVPEGNYLIVNGSIMDNNSFEINKGIHEILDTHIKEKRIVIVGEIWLDEWKYDEALEKIGKFLESGIRVDAISAANDNMAQAAIRLLSERQLAGYVPIVGQDADLNSCQSVVEGTQLMTVYKPIHKLAVRAAKLAVGIARKEVQIADGFFDNGSGVEIPYFIEDPISVFKEQMDETVISDGFHSREDVYRNIIEQK